MKKFIVFHLIHRLESAQYFYIKETNFKKIKPNFFKPFSVVRFWVLLSLSYTVKQVKSSKCQSYIKKLLIILKLNIKQL